MRRHILVLLAASAWAAAQEEVLVDFGAAMRYVDNRTNPGLGATWIERSFDDAAWTAGQYGVGYDAGGFILTDVPDGTLSVYTRVHFTLGDPALLENMYLGVDFDDAYVAWINGAEVARENMPGGNPDWNTATTDQHESSNAATPDFTPLKNITQAAAPALLAGDNVLAIGVWNTSTTSSDLALAPRLSINRPTATGSEVCGELAADTTWTAAESPYLMTCDVTIPQGVTLTIEPGVTIYAQSGAGLVIEGALNGVGTAEAPIVFTREESGHWGGLEFDLGGQGSPASSHVAFAELWYPSTGLHVQDTGSATVLFEDTAIDHWTGVAVDWDNAPRLILRRCAFGVETPEPEAHSETMHGYVRGALVEYCTFGRRYGYNDVIDLGDLTWERGDVPIIRYNTFLGGDDDAIDFDGADGWIIGNRINDHWPTGGPSPSSSANGGGITGSAGSRTIVMNNIITNTYHAIGYKDGCEVWIINNTIVDCHIGFTLYHQGCSDDDSVGHLYNNIIWGCDTDGNGDPMTILLNGRWFNAYCTEGDVHGTLDIRQCIIEGGWPTGTGVFDTDPLLADPAGGDFTPQFGSPVIDAGFGGPLVVSDVDPAALAAEFARDRELRGRVDVPCVDDTGNANAGGITHTDLGAMEFQDLTLCGGPIFVRADVNRDQRHDISDAVGILRYLFGGIPTDCQDALDTNDDGQLDIADALYLLGYLFDSGSPAPPPPFPGPGLDPTDEDGIGCERI